MLQRTLQEIKHRLHASPAKYGWHITHPKACVKTVRVDKQMKITNFLNQQNAHFLFIIQYNFFTVKSDQHVSVPYFGTIIRDPYLSQLSIGKHNF
jgi:hypothetical protein